MRKTAALALAIIQFGTLTTGTIYLAGNSTTYSIDTDGRIRFAVQADTVQNTVITLQDQNGQQFQMYAGYWRFRFPSAHRYFLGYREYPTDCPMQKGDWYNVSIDFPATRLTIMHRNTTTCRLDHDLMARGDATTFRPDRITLKSSDPDEDARFRIRTDQQDQIIVVPRYRPLLAVSVTNVSYTIAPLPRPGATNIGHRTGAAITAAEWLARQAFPDPIHIPENRSQAIYAAQYALEHGRGISFTSGDPVPRQAIERLRHRRQTDHLIVTRPDVASTGLIPSYAARRHARILMARSPDPDQIRAAIQTTVATLDTASLRGRAGPIYLTLHAVPRFIRQDPIRSTFGGDERIDGRTYPTDRPYTDIDGDGSVDLAYGRLPADPRAARNVLAPHQGDSASVLAAYRTETWIGTTANNGAGMVSGHQAAALLQAHGKTVDLIVENRTPMTALQAASVGFLSMLSGTPDPQATDAFIRSLLEGMAGDPQDPSQTLLQTELAAKGAIAIQRPTGTIRFQGLLSSISGALGAIKAAMDLSTILRGVLEYRYAPDMPRLRRFMIRFSDASWQERSILIMDALIEHRPALTTGRARSALRSSDIVVYTGHGNGTHWILPNRDGGDIDIPDSNGQDLFNQYNGTNAVRPTTTDALIYDLSGSSRGREGIARTALRNGASGYLGFTALTYEPFVGQLLAAYLANGITHGQAYMAAANSHRGLIGLLNPKNTIRTGPLGDVGEEIRKTGRSMIQYLPPERRKDPAVGLAGTHTVDCDPVACHHRRVYPRTAIRDATRTIRTGNGSLPYYSIQFPAASPHNITVTPALRPAETESLFRRPAHTIQTDPRSTGGSRVRITGAAATTTGQIQQVTVSYTTPPAIVRLQRIGDQVQATGTGFRRYGVVARNRTHRRWLGTADRGDTLPLDGLTPGRWQLTAIATADGHTLRDRLVIQTGQRRQLVVRLLENLPLRRPYPDGFGPDLGGTGAVALHPGSYDGWLHDGTPVRITVRSGLSQDPAYRYREHPTPILHIGSAQAQITARNRSVTITSGTARYSLHQTPTMTIEWYNTSRSRTRLTGLPQLQDNDIGQRRRLALQLLSQLRALYRGLHDRTEVNQR